MASFNYWYNKAAVLLDKKELDLHASASLKVMLTTDTHVPNKDDAFINDSGADDALDGEIDAVTNYAGGFDGDGRKVLGTPTVTVDTSNDRAVFDATGHPTWSDLGGTVNAIVMYATIVSEVSSDADSPVILTLDVNSTAGIQTNGGDFVIQFNAAGIGYSQQ